MSQVHSPISSTTPEALRAAIAEAVQVDAQQLQSAVGSIQVATSEQLQVTDPQIKSLYDADSRTLTLLVDRIPAGQEAEDFAAALIQHLGHNISADLIDADYGCEIYVSPNRDTYRGGFEWSICKDGVVLDEGLDFTEEDARKSAQRAIENDEFMPDGKLPNYTGQTNVAEKEASSKLPLALQKLVPHVLHYASMPNAHADAHRDVADARRVLADVAKDTQKVSTSIDQSSQSGEQLVLAISDAALLVEINRRGILRPLYGAIGAMHDHLDRTGALDEHLSQYLTYRLRREEAAITGMPDSAARVANWQECIDQLDREARAVKVEDSPSPGM